MAKKPEQEKITKEDEITETEKEAVDGIRETEKETKATSIDLDGILGVPAQSASVMDVHAALDETYLECVFNEGKPVDENRTTEKDTVGGNGEEEKICKEKEKRSKEGERKSKEGQRRSKEEKRGMTLWENCCEGNLESARTALKGGGDPNSRGGFFNRTCLMIAVHNLDEDPFLDRVVDLLLAQKGIDVNAKDRYNSTALHIAGAYGNLDTLRKLLAVPGLLLNEKDNGGRTPMMQAVILGKTRAVQLMVAKKFAREQQAKVSKVISTIDILFLILSLKKQTLGVVVWPLRQQQHLQQAECHAGSTK